jgi:xanthine dehydrogenase YagS FAD-binding subunit
MMRQFSYKRASTLQEAAAASARPGSRLLAGGTDLLGCLRDDVFGATTLVSLNQLKELKGVMPRQGGGLRLGALATLTEVSENKRVQEAYSVLAEAAHSAASPQLRNQGTVGGNLCQRPRCWFFRGDFPCFRKGGENCSAMEGRNEFHAIFGGDPCYMVHPSDTASALVALDAKVTIASAAGRRTLPLSQFFILPKTDFTRENVLKPGEIVTEILLDAPAADMRSKYRKVRERGAFDFAVAGAAIVLRMAAGKVAFARVVLSGVAPIPWRSEAAEKALLGQELSGATVTAAASAAVKGASPLSHNAYKVPMVQGILEETLLSLA